MPKLSNFTFRLLILLFGFISYLTINSLIPKVGPINAFSPKLLLSYSKFKFDQISTTELHNSANYSLKSSREVLRSVRLLCFVTTCRKNLMSKAKAVRDTWSKRCDKTVFISDEANDTFPAINISGIIPGYQHLWSKSVHSVIYLHKNYLDQFDWFLKSDDDNYVIVENLKAFLAQSSPRDPHVFGKRFKTHGGYNSGGAGYVMSREALSRLGKHLIGGNCENVNNTPAEDVAIGKCLREVGVVPGYTLDSEQKETFHALSLHHELEHVYPAWMLQYTYHPLKQGMDCCSNLTISFHYTSPGEMLAMEYLLYHARVFGESFYPQSSTIHRHYENR